ncbi:MAG: glycosyltransferase [Paracoccaceae bacterium]
MTHLMMIAPAPAICLSDGRLRLDVKYVEGMRAHAELWDGPISAVVWEGASSVPFGADYARSELGFDLTVLPAGADLPKISADLIAAPADMAETLALAWGPVPVVFMIEYTIGTRLRIVALDHERGMVRKAWSALWNLGVERKRRAAFRRAAGVQCNGYPAFDAYAALNKRSMLYLDGRMRADMMATSEEMAAKAAWSGPLRLVHSGRLEPMKGAQDLVPVARALLAAGVDFTLDVFGTGSLEENLRAGSADLDGRLRLHAPVDFGSALVPWLRTHADLFLSCHRQADPSCTYLESLGCGVPVIGYANEMWGRMAQVTGGGWAVPLGDRRALADQLVRLAGSRADLRNAASAGLAFAQAHDFKTEFTSRMTHLERCLIPLRAVA